MNKKTLLFLIIVIYIDFFLFMPYCALNIGRVVKSVVLVFLVFSLFKSRKVKANTENFKNEIGLLAILPLISAFSSWYYRGQPVLVGLIVARTSLFWLLYYYLHKVRYSPQIIIQVITNIAIVSSVIYIAQQLFYPSLYLFNSLQHADEVEIRQGLYRFRLFQLNPYIFFSFYYYLWKFIEKKEITSLGWVSFFLIAIYLTLTRQIYFCIFIPAILFPFFRRNDISTKTIMSFLIGVLLLCIAYQNIGTIIGDDFVKRTENESNENNIRVLSYIYYGLEYWVNEFNMIFGNGAASWGNSAYGNEIQDIEDNQGLFRADIGIVGNFNMYGIVYIVALFSLYIKFFKLYRLTPVYIRLVLVASIINLPLACWTDDGIFMAMVFYLIDFNVIEKSMSSKRQLCNVDKASIVKTVYGYN